MYADIQNARRSEFIRRITAAITALPERYSSKKTIRRRKEQLENIRSLIPSPLFDERVIISRILDELSGSVEQYRTQYANLLAALANDTNGRSMLYTLSWKTDDLMTAAAKLALTESLYERLLPMPDAESMYVSYQAFVADLTSEVLSQASRSGASRSTSTVSNLVEDVTNSVKADFLRSPYWESSTLCELRHLVEQSKFATEESVAEFSARLDELIAEFDIIVANAELDA